VKVITHGETAEPWVNGGASPLRWNEYVRSKNRGGGQNIYIVDQITYLPIFGFIRIQDRNSETNR